MVHFKDGGIIVIKKCLSVAYDVFLHYKQPNLISGNSKHFGHL
jgi:hypothetical protein